MKTNPTPEERARRIMEYAHRQDLFRRGKRHSEQLTVGERWELFEKLIEAEFKSQRACMEKTMEKKEEDAYANQSVRTLPEVLLGEEE